MINSSRWINTRVVIDIETGQVLEREGFHYSGPLALLVDDVILNSGAGGATAATDDIAGVHHQRVKLSVGADGSASDAIPISAGLNTTAAGVQAVGLAAQLDDTTPSTVTEDQFGPVRMSSRRALLVEGVASGTAIAVTESGSSTSARQDTIIGHLDGVEGLLTTIDTDTGNLTAQVFDFDSGAGTDNTVALGIAVAASGGAVAITGDVTNGLDVDVTRVTGTVTVDGSAVTQPISAASLPLPTGASTLAEQQTQTTALQLLDNIVRSEDEASATGHAGAVVLAKRSNTPAATSDLDGDYEPLQVTGGRLAVQATGSGTFTVDGSAVTQPVSHTGLTELAAAINASSQIDTNVAAVSAGVSIEVVGDVAHDVAAAGNPVLGAGISQDIDDTAPPNRVSAESDSTRLATDRDGALFVHPHGPQVWSYHANGSTALTDASVHVDPGAGLSLYVTDIVCSSGAATAMNIFFEEGVTTVLGPYYLEAVAGRGLVIRFQTPKKITVNTALTVTTSAAIAHSVDVTGFTAQG